MLLTVSGLDASPRESCNHPGDSIGTPAGDGLWNGPGLGTHSPCGFSFDYVRKFSELPPGSTLFIPINPAGWTMQLMKH